MRSDLGGIPGVTLPSPGEPLRRDMELIRELLLELEAGGGARDISRWSDATLRGHLSLMVQGGLLDGRATGSTVEVRGITWAGHDFLGAVRADAVWRSVLDRIAEAGGDLPFEAVTQLAISLLP
jgi:hypothetical protein